MDQNSKSLTDLYIEGEFIFAKERIEELKAKQEEWDRITSHFYKLWNEIETKIPACLLKYVRCSNEEIRDIVFKGNSQNFHCDIENSLPVFLSIDIRHEITVEYLVPAIILANDDFKFGLFTEGNEEILEDYHVFQTDEPARAVYLAAERYRALKDLQEEKTREKAEPEYEPIELTQMVNPSLDDLINLRIEQAIKKALAA